MSLAPESKHGYAILKDVEILSEGRVQMSTGTLYGAIRRLLGEGLIKRVDDSGATSNKREIKPYALTERGHRVLNAEVERLEKLIAAAKIRVAKETT
jgi:DNA-binding PadR family transcriptional regulator